ncbi:MAG: hypothetical protein IT374_26180 [Polyangiaceae bacterium]|nr:hypothetical protein [Polyangiaceae bacterium]
MSARSIRDWERLGSEAESEDRRIAEREGLEPIHPRNTIDEMLAYHFCWDLDNPEITPDRDAAIAALVRGYREGA